MDIGKFYNKHDLGCMDEDEVIPFIRKQGPKDGLTPGQVKEVVSWLKEEIADSKDTEEE